MNGALVGFGVFGAFVGFTNGALVGFGVFGAFVGLMTGAFVGFGVLENRPVCTASKSMFLFFSDASCASSISVSSSTGSNLFAIVFCLQPIEATPFGGFGRSVTSSLTSRSSRMLHSKKLFG